MASPGGQSKQLEVLTQRIDVLQRLCDEPAHKRDLVSDLEQSRSTIDRAIRDLEELAFVERCDAGITATPAGRLAVEHLQSFQAGLADIVTAEAVLNPLPVDSSLTTDVVAGGEAMLATEPVPYRPLEGVHNALTEADSYRLVLPGLDDPRHIRLLYEHVVTRSKPAELVVTPALFETLREEFPRRMAAMAEHDEFRLLVAKDLPPFALCLADSDGSTTVSVVVFGNSGTVHGVLRNETTDAVAWATDCHERVRAAGTDRTEALLNDSGPEGRADADGGVVALGESLSVALEREGFVRLDIDYFRDEPVADPTTAWRAGLSLAEVHTGYAVERKRDGRAMSDQLREALLGGEDCIVVGPPGAGKSTLCKRVACEWYDDDRGPVLYREQGRGRPFGSVEDLVVTADAADGHTLVVVEDAVRPEANAVFDAIDRLADRDDVSFLLDSRETEWLDPPEPLGCGADLQVTTVPRLDEQACQRLIAHFERTVGERIEVPAKQLWQEVQTELTSEGTAASGILLLLHRLSTYANPLSGRQTRLEEAVSALAEDLGGDELARSVCLLANTLNAAGLGVDRDALYAVADPAEYAAVDAALERLEGRILFARPDGCYRTVHESWSVAFLVAQLEQEPTAAEEFGAVVTSLLSLAEDPGRREQIREHVDEARTINAIEESPRSWAGEMVETLYTLGRERPKLARLFGDGETDTIELSTPTPTETTRQVPVWLGRMFLAGGYDDAAERAFERLSTEQPDDAIERLLGLARVATETGSYDEATALAEECLSLIDKDERPLVEARAKLVIGRVATNRGDYEQASSHLQQARNGFETTGEKRQLGAALDLLGRAARDQGDYEDAREFLQQSLTISRRLGDRAGTASSHTALGTAVFGLGEYDRAREHFERSLDIARERGNRYQELDNLKWLGSVAMYRSEYDRAEEYFERSLKIARERDDPRREGEILGSVGLLAERVGEYDRAREYLSCALDLAAELGNSRNVVSRHNNLGLVAVRVGEHDRAREQFETGLAVAREHGHRRHEANSLNGLGHVAQMRGNYERAREYHEKALAITEDIGNTRRIADSNNKLGLVALKLGESDRARERFKEGRALALDIDNPREAAKALTGLGELARIDGDYEQASEHVEAALAHIEPTGAGIETTHVRLAAARLALDRGDHEEARELGERIRGSYEEIGAIQWAGRSERLLGRIAAADGDDATAREHWESALELLADVDAPQDELATLRLLLEGAEDRGDDEAAERWRERIDERVADVPQVVVEQHREWLDEQLE